MAAVEEGVDLPSVIAGRYGSSGERVWLVGNDAISGTSVGTRGEWVAGIRDAKVDVSSNEEGVAEETRDAALGTLSSAEGAAESREGEVGVLSREEAVEGFNKVGLPLRNPPLLKDTMGGCQ